MNCVNKLAIKPRLDLGDLRNPIGLDLSNGIIIPNEFICINLAILMPLLQFCPTNVLKFPLFTLVLSRAMSTQV